MYSFIFMTLELNMDFELENTTRDDTPKMVLNPQGDRN